MWTSHDRDRFRQAFDALWPGKLTSDELLRTWGNALGTYQVPAAIEALQTIKRQQKRHITPTVRQVEEALRDTIRSHAARGFPEALKHKLRATGRVPARGEWFEASEHGVSTSAGFLAWGQIPPEQQRAFDSAATWWMRQPEYHRGRELVPSAEVAADDAWWADRESDPAHGEAYRRMRRQMARGEMPDLLKCREPGEEG